MFKRMLQAVGVGGPSVDAVLNESTLRPGGRLTGEVRVGGASESADIERITLGFVVEVEVEVGDQEQKTTVEFHRVTVADAFNLDGGEYKTIPFAVAVPWEIPLTVVNGQPLRGMRVGVRTEVAIDRAVDASDLDPVHVEPLDSQRVVIDALLNLGARIVTADVEHGRIHGIDQQNPFYQEIEYAPPRQFAGRVSQVELTFVAREDSVDIVLEADKRGGLLRAGGDVYGRFRTSHAEALNTDWVAACNQWLETVANGR